METWAEVSNLRELVQRLLVTQRCLSYMYVAQYSVAVSIGRWLPAWVSTWMQAIGTTKDPVLRKDVMMWRVCKIAGNHQHVLSDVQFITDATDLFYFREQPDRPEGRRQ